MQFSMVTGFESGVTNHTV